MLARWQFGITTVYHFLFVPLTIGLAFTVAGLQTAWYRTERREVPAAHPVLRGAVPDQLRAGPGDRHRPGVPVRDELERATAGSWATSSAPRSRSRGCSPSSSSPRSSASGSSAGAASRKGVHLATIWVAAIGTVLSAYFILAANSWMQHPVGYAVNPVTGRAELTDFLALLTNSTALITFAHTIPAAFMTTGAFIAGIAMYRMLKDRETARGRRAVPVDRQGRRRDAPRVGPAGRGHRRHPGQDHDRAAADEDGRRRGALGDRAARLLLDLHDRHARRDARRSSRSGSRTCSRSWPPAPSTARSRASTTSRRSRRRSSGPATTRPTRRSPTGRSAG